MAFDFDGSTSYLELGSALRTAVPLTFACWFHSDSTTVDQALVSISGSVTNSYFRLEASGAQTGDPIRARVSNASAATSSSSASGYVANRWTHAAGVFASNTSRTAYKDGVGGTTDTNNRTPVAGNLTSTDVGVYYLAGTLTSFTNGRIAEAAIWDCALTPSEIREAAAGKPHNLIRPENLILYLPLGEDRSTTGQSRLRSVFANTAAVPVSARPPALWQPPSRQFWRANSVAASSFQVAWARNTNSVLQAGLGTS